MLTDDDLKDLEKRISDAELSRIVSEFINLQPLEYHYIGNQLYKMTENGFQAVDYLKLNKIYNQNL